MHAWSVAHSATIKLTLSRPSTLALQLWCIIALSSSTMLFNKWNQFICNSMMQSTCICTAVCAILNASLSAAMLRCFGQTSQQDCGAAMLRWQELHIQASTLGCYYLQRKFKGKTQICFKNPQFPHWMVYPAVCLMFPVKSLPHYPHALQALQCLHMPSFRNSWHTTHQMKLLWQLQICCARATSTGVVLCRCPSWQATCNDMHIGTSNHQRTS